MSRKNKTLYRFIVKGEQFTHDDKSLGIYEREVWAKTKVEAANRFPKHEQFRTIILSVRQVGGKKVEDE